MHILGRDKNDKKSLEMLKTIYFHIGTVKTGTTLIQKTLWGNRDVLKKFDVSYLDLVPPRISYSRYANAEFLVDAEINVSSTDIETYLDNLDVSRTIISEEGLWANLSTINHPAFAKYDKVIILYVRRPAELIASWAAENAEPYNATQKKAASGMGVVPVSKGIKEYTKRYSRIFQNFFNTIDQIGCTKVVVRPYERRQFYRRDVFSDFLGVLNINPEDFFHCRNVNYSKAENISRTRKFYDVSHAVWVIMKDMGMESEYGLQAVTYVYVNCRYGDDRPVIETLDNDSIKVISDELQFIEEEISERFLDGARLFESRLPLIYNKKRHPYQTLMMDEVEKLTYQYLHSMRVTIKRLLRPIKNLLIRA